MKNTQNNSGKFVKFSNVLDKKEMNVLFGGSTSGSTTASNGGATSGNANANTGIVPLPGF